MRGGAASSVRISSVSRIVIAVVIVYGFIVSLDALRPLEARPLLDEAAFTNVPSSVVAIDYGAGKGFRYLVNDKSQVFIGMGYNPIYRHLSDSERAAMYDRDFGKLCEAGVNHIIGWDADKGYEQDKFDVITLDAAHRHGIGVVMPFFLPFDGDYEDEVFRQNLLEQAAEKVIRFNDHPAIRMWGPGNEVFADMAVAGLDNGEAFARFYVEVADLFHSLDPVHPVVYRDAEDSYFPILDAALEDNIDRPWLLYGINAYSPRLDEILRDWPSRTVVRPLIVSEFGAEPDWRGDRAGGYSEMWQTIRAHRDYVLGGAPYAWTMEGPEPTDLLWGLTDHNGEPIDDTFGRLAINWQSEPEANICR